ncbi:MAG: matrixin family metalloprotease [Gammaproteobacteria bacterium]
MQTIRPCIAAVMLGLGSQSAYALNLDIDYTSYDSSGFFTDTARQKVFDAAANYFETRITDALLPIVSMQNGNSFTATFDSPDTDTTTHLSSFNIAADTLKIFVGGRDLGSKTLGLGGPGGSAISFIDSSYIDAVTSRGQGDGTESSVNGASAYDFATWGGAISFNTTKTWYFDDDTSTDESFTGFDFFSVAVHEIAHILGFGTADSWGNKIATASNVFFGSESVASYGGDVPLETPPIGQLPGHWAPGTKSDGVETAMDPTIAAGTRKHFTSLDIAGLRDIGWQMSAAPVPVPAAIWLFGSALVGVLGLSRFKTASV